MAEETKKTTAAKSATTQKNQGILSKLIAIRVKTVPMYTTAIIGTLTSVNFVTNFTPPKAKKPTKTIMIKNITQQVGCSGEEALGSNNSAIAKNPEIVLKP